MKSSSEIHSAASRWPVRPTYAAEFRCIGASCEDGCCGGWDVPVDRLTYQKYLGFRDEKLVQIVARSVLVERPNGPDGLYARIWRNAAGRCPFQGADKLCGIQQEYGAAMLSATCSIYPRALSWVEGRLEGSLSLSCPEAARKVLLDPEWMRVQGDLFSGGFRTDNSFRLACDATGFIYKPGEAYLAIRGLILAIVGDRSRSIVVRLLVIGDLCQRMDQAVKAGRKRQLVRIAGDHVRGAAHMIVAPDTGGTSKILGLKLFRELGEARLREGVGPRFGGVLEGFFACVGDGDDASRFEAADVAYVRPFFEQRPHILENLLANSMFQNLFPYGREGSADFASLSMFDEWMLMTTQFAWIYALLVGVASRCGAAFGEEHVVMTVQSYAREVEHYPAVLQSVLASVRARGFDSLQGMGLLLGSRGALVEELATEPIRFAGEARNFEEEIQKLLSALRRVRIPEGIAQRILEATDAVRVGGGGSVDLRR